MSLDYTKITHESLLAEWNNRVLADERYKNLSHASIYSFFQEFLAGTMDLVNYYIQRTAEENYLDTAKLDSSVIKLGHNLGYQPRRPSTRATLIPSPIKTSQTERIRLGARRLLMRLTDTLDTKRDTSPLTAV